MKVSEIFHMAADKYPTVTASTAEESEEILGDDIESRQWLFCLEH